MLRKLAPSCIDINSAYCPCMLADTNNCNVCSQLSGKDLCECNWSGLCILYERQWQDKAKSCRSELPNLRQESDSSITRRELIAPETYLLEFAVSDELAQELKKTGAFVFLRRQDDPQYFHFPVGVMKVSQNTIQVVIEAVGPKSKRLLTADLITVRGPYYNGVFGQPWIDNITCGTILLIAGGMGQPPALPIAAKLRANDNEVIAVLAPGKIGKIFIDSELREMGVTVYCIDSMRRSGLNELRQWFDADGLPDLLVSAGPDEQHHAAIAAMQAAGVNLPMAATNNATMCCGEGICGSCECLTKDSRTIRVCKIQTDFIQLGRIDPQ